MDIYKLYTPKAPRERKVFFDNLWRFRPGEVNLLVAGDFNCVEDVSLDKQGGNPESATIGMDELWYFVESNGLSDIWRVQHPTDRQFTWQNKDFTQRSRLDRWYVAGGTDGRTSIRACAHSDQSAIELLLELKQGKNCGKGSWKKRGKGSWKLNNSVLEDRSFQRDTGVFHEFWKGKKDDFASLQEWWDKAKEHYKALAVTHAVGQSRQQDREMGELLGTLSTLKATQVPDVEWIRATEQAIQDIENKKAEAAKIRSRASGWKKRKNPQSFSST